MKLTTIVAWLRRLVNSEERIMHHMLEIENLEGSTGEQELSELLPHARLQPEDVEVVDASIDDDVRLRGLESSEERNARRAHLTLAWTNRQGSRKAS